MIKTMVLTKNHVQNRLIKKSVESIVAGPHDVADGAGCKCNLSSSAGSIPNVPCFLSVDLAVKVRVKTIGINVLNYFQLRENFPDTETINYCCDRDKNAINSSLDGGYY